MNSIALIDKDISTSTFAVLSIVLSLGGIIGAYLGFPLADYNGRRFGFFTADIITVLGVILVSFT